MHMKESIFVRFGKWFTNGGVLKMIGRAFLLLGIAAAIALAAVGYVDMVQTRDAEQIAKYEANVVKAQQREYDNLVKAAKKAEKNGEVPPEIPEDPSLIEVEVKPVVYSLSDYLSDFITKYVLWAVLSIAAGVGLNGLFGNVMGWITALKKAGRRKVIAGAILWAGILVAAIIAAIGVVEIMAIKKSTLGEVGSQLMKNHIVWSVVAVGCGLSIQQLILRYDAEKKHVLNSGKGSAAGHWIYLIALALFPFAVTACVAVGIPLGWVTALLCLLGVCVVMLLAWMASGTCPLIRSKEEAAAEAQRKGRTSWVCSCGQENARHVALCSVCGEPKPKH